MDKTTAILVGVVVVAAGLLAAGVVWRGATVVGDNTPVPHLRQYTAETGYRDLLEYTLPDGTRCYKFVSTAGISCLAPASVRQAEGGPR